jgi:hypothetical protein
MAPDLSKFKASQAVAQSLKLVGGIGVDQILTVAYTDGKFTADTQVVGGPLGQVFELDAAQQKTLLAALKEEQRAPHHGVDGSVLELFVHLLSGSVHSQPSNLFDNARFGDIAKDEKGVITLGVGQGVDVVGTVYDDKTTIKYEQHPLPLKGGTPHALSPADRRSLAAALTKFIGGGTKTNPLYGELLGDVNKTLAY